MCIYLSIIYKLKIILPNPNDPKAWKIDYALSFAENLLDRIVMGDTSVVYSEEYKLLKTLYNNWVISRAVEYK